MGMQKLMDASFNLMYEHIKWPFFKNMIYSFKMVMMSKIASPSKGTMPCPV